jgi:rare lipoprotein A (peptidoglycan hydrolase)
MAGRDTAACAQGNANEKEKDAMSMRRLIGISFACLMTSACAIEKTPEESTSNAPDDPARFPQANGETPTGESARSAESLITTVGSPTITCDPAEQPLAAFEPPADRRDGIPNPCCSPLRTTGTTLFGKVAWYNLVGRQTASGEILDAVTATAAHRSLPLASYAKVTNIGNGHSVVVKINDRGPYTRGRILDLSPRAADALDMKRVGVAAVVVEPLANQAGPTVAVLQPSGTEVSQ